MSERILHALACLIHASYIDNAPSGTARDGWRAVAADAREEYDRLRAQVEELEKWRSDYPKAASTIAEQAKRIAELEHALRECNEHCFTGRYREGNPLGCAPGGEGCGVVLAALAGKPEGEGG